MPNALPFVLIPSMKYFLAAAAGIKTKRGGDARIERTLTETSVSKGKEVFAISTTYGPGAIVNIKLSQGNVVK